MNQRTIRVWAAGFLALGLISRADAAAEEQADRVAATVAATIRALQEKHRIPGIAVGIIVGGRSHVFSFGVVSTETQKPVTRDTLFELGSISKTFTVTLAAWAQAEGRLEWADPVGKHLISLQGTKFGGVGILHLATHTPGGFPLQLPDEIKSQAQLMEYYAKWQPASAPGTQRNYANPSVGALALIAAKSWEGEFPALIQQRLFPALGLTNSFIDVPPARMADYAQGYTKEDRPVRMTPAVLASETYGVKASASDVLHFLAANLGLVNLEPRLQRAITATHTGYFQAGPMTQDLIWEQYPYPVALPVLLEGNSPAMIFNPTPVTALTPPQPPGEDVWINKTGSTSGFGAYVAFVPAKSLAIVILANKNYPIEERVTAAYEILSALAAGDR